MGSGTKLERLKREKEQKEREERHEFVLHAYEELKASLNEIVEAFNKSYDYGKLILRDASSGSKLRLSVIVPGGQQVELFVEPVDEDLTFRNEKVLAWGYFRNSNGRGFNVVLVRSEKDLYGNWLCFHNRHSSLVPKQDSRPDLFPFAPFSEFKEEIRNVNVMHIYQTSVAPFSKDMLVSIFEDIL